MDTLHFKLDSPQIAAQIYYLNATEGGRKTPIQSGYRGQFHIRSSDWDAVQEFIGTAICNPGETVNVYIKFATAHKIIPMTEGSAFEIREGKRVIGRGVITSIIDKSILQTSSGRELYKHIDDVAWNYWDPIGVNTFEEARDEYYSYLPHIFRLILNNANKETIAKYLYKVETENMGLFGNYEKCLLSADKFLASNNQTQSTG